MTRVLKREGSCPPEMRPSNFCIAFVALASLSLCTFASAAVPPMGDARDARLRHARREIAEALQPSVAQGAKPDVETARTGVGAGDASRDPPPGEDIEFIAADIGQESATPHDDTAFLGTVEVEPGTTPPETTAPPQ